MHNATETGPHAEAGASQFSGSGGSHCHSGPALCDSPKRYLRVSNVMGREEECGVFSLLQLYRYWNHSDIYNRDTQC